MDPPSAGGGRADLQDLQGLQHAIAMARERPTRLRLELDDSTFAVGGPRGHRTAVPMHGDEIELAGVQWPTLGKVEWHKRVPSLIRSVQDGGEVVDRFELVAEDRLVVTRRFRPARGRDVEARLVYDRERGRAGGG